MSLTVKIVIFAAIALIELLVALLVGLRMASRGRGIVAIALAMSCFVTLVVVGFVLFVVLG